jgi:predicted transcriptional regulator
VNNGSKRARAAAWRSEVLGALEAAIMAHVWDTGPCDVKAAYDAVGRARGITLNTVQSTMERLGRKGLLDRRKVSHAYVYSARVSREGFGARIVRDVVQRFLGGRPAPMLAAFVDLAARAGDDELERLERLIAEHRDQRGRT